MVQKNHAEFGCFGNVHILQAIRILNANSRDPRIVTLSLLEVSISHLTYIFVSVTFQRTISTLDLLPPLGRGAIGYCGARRGCCQRSRSVLLIHSKPGRLTARFHFMHLAQNLHSWNQCLGSDLGQQLAVVAVGHGTRSSAGRTSLPVIHRGENRILRKSYKLISMVVCFSPQCTHTTT